MIVYISGGCKNGKSTIGEKIAYNLKKNDKLYYIATMNPFDNEDLKRIEKHKKDRANLPFETIEIHNNIKNLENIVNLNNTFFIDSVTALLANEMFIENNINKNAYKKVSEDLLYLIKKMKNVVLISDYIFSDSIIYDNNVNLYKKSLAYIDKKCANISDLLLEICYNNIIIHKGDWERIKIC